MLVCHCRAVSDRTIREAVQSGAGSCEAVADTCGAGTGCGGCRELVSAIVAEELTGGPRPLIQLRRGSEPAPEAAAQTG